MSEETDSQSQICAGFFRRPRLGTGLKNLYLIFNLTRVFNILENIVGTNGIRIVKPRGAAGIGWQIAGSGGIPEGYAEETVNIITDSGIVTRTVLTKTDDSATVESFSSSDSRLLLSINADGVVRKSKGYLKS